MSEGDGAVNTDEASRTGGARGGERLRNEFSWSRSRDQLFRECPRRYYYNYYASWGGWEADAPETTRRLYVLKQLKSRHMWAGEVVHGVVEQVLRDLGRGITLPRAEEAVASALARMRESFKDSREGRYWRRPKYTLGLFEHEYQLDVTDDDWRQNAEHVATCIRNFFASDVYARLKAMPADDFLEIEKLSTFEISGVKVWVKLDCCLQAGSGVFIIDWKTGRSDRGEHANQLACYALYAARQWGVEPRQIQTLVYNLALAEGRTYQITADTVSQARDEIMESAGAMRGYLVDAGGNEPLPEAEFPLSTDERPCRWCNFRGACPRFSGE
jgi:hypothetical protein